MTDDKEEETSFNSVVDWYESNDHYLITPTRHPHKYAMYDDNIDVKVWVYDCESLDDALDRIKYLLEARIKRENESD